MPSEQRDPYIGLRPYGQGDRDRFFGRTSECQELGYLWPSKRLVVLYGPSGVGKTSLINAGMLPAFLDSASKGRADLLPVGRIPHSVAFLSPNDHQTNPYVFTLLSSWGRERSAWGRERSAAELTETSLVEFLRTHPDSRDDPDDPLPLLAAIDQFEEVFSDGPYRGQHREDFIAQLSAAMEEVPRLHLIISIREEYLARLLPYEGLLGQYDRTRVGVTALNRETALEAVVGPLRQTARRFATGVAEKLVDDLSTVTLTNSIGQSITVRTEAVEPVHLQIACSGLWSSLPPTVTTITAEHLQDYGDVDRMLLDFAFHTVAEIAGEFGLPEAEVWSWLDARFVTDRGNRGNVYEGITETGGMRNEVAQALESRRILRSEDRLGSRWYELQHDRLIGPIRKGAAVWDMEPNRIDPSPAGHLRIAEAALAEGNLTLAEKYALEGLRLGGPSDLRNRGETHSFLAQLAWLRGETEDAVGRYREALDAFALLQDDHAMGRLRAQLGRIFYAAGDNLAAMVELNEAVRLLPGDLQIKIEMARCLRDANQPYAAISMLTAALTISPDLVPALIERGLIQLRLGDTDAARTDLENAVRLDPEAGVQEDVQAALAALRRG